jgi:hypothetical protein
VPYEVEVGAKADAQLAALDAAIGAGVERKVQWLAENAAGMVHRGLWECQRIWRAAANFASAIIGSFIGSIRENGSSASTAYSIARKCIDSSERL